MRYARVPTEIGDLIVAGPGAVAEIRFDPHRGRSPLRPSWARDDDAFPEAAAQLVDWLAGRRRDFDLETAASGTPFQHRVWAALRSIPYGTTATYAALAAEVGSVPRAVGHANAANPLSIVVPCHRLVGSGGSLTGYAGGVDVKRRLLDLETAVAGRVGSSSLRP